MRQVSNSTKASLKVKRKEGKIAAAGSVWLSAQPVDKYKLIVDEDVRSIIKDIFTMA